MNTRALASQVLYQPVSGPQVSVQDYLDSLTGGGGGGGGGTSGEYGPVSGYIELPSSIGSGTNSGIPNRGPTTLKVQYGTAASPATLSTERAISSQAVVAPTFPWTNPSHWSPNEFSVINKGVGRVNALNAVLVTDQNLEMDNTIFYTYGKGSYVGTKTGEGGIVGMWNIMDTRGSNTRAVCAEFILLHDFEDHFDPTPKSVLSGDYGTPDGVFHVGVRISTLLSSKIVPRALDIITGSDTAGFDTGIAIHGFRSRGLFFHNNLNPSVGGARAAIEFADTIDNCMVWNTKDGTPYLYQQGYSASKGYYYNFRKDASNLWLAMYADGTVTLSGSTATGTKLLVNPDGSIFAGHTTKANAGFHVPTGGRFWLNDEKTSYIGYAGSALVIVKNGSVVASY